MALPQSSDSEEDFVDASTENISIVLDTDGLSQSINDIVDSVLKKEYQSIHSCGDNLSVTDQMNCNPDAETVNESIVSTSEGTNEEHLSTRTKRCKQETCSSEEHPEHNTGSDADEISNADDSDYAPSDIPETSSSSSEAEESTINESRAVRPSRHSSDYSLNTSFNIPGNSACDNQNQISDLSKGPKGGQKKNFCFYCHQMQSKIARHLINKHSNEIEVKKFMCLPEKSAERLKLIAAIRKKGNFIFNINAEWNEGKVIPVRRPTQVEKSSATNFETCPSCRGLYTKNNLRHHNRICRKSKSSNPRSVLTLARSVVGRIHPCASKVLRQRIFPVMRDDNISRLIRYDELLILYGNKLCKTLPLPHQHDEIRAHLRRAGKFLEIAKNHDQTIANATDIFDPKYYNIAIESVNILAGLDPETQLYKTPSNASAMGTALKKLGLILEAECIKKHDDEKKKNTKDFLKLLAADYGCTINKNVAESQTHARQGKEANLPKVNDIQKLNNHLDTIIMEESERLTENFSAEAWTNLAEATLIKIQVFNRKRAGEIERVTIEQINNRTTIKEDDDLYRDLSSQDRLAAQKYARVVIRGKKNRPVAFLISSDVLKAVQLLLKYRKNVNVPSKNPFVFGVFNRDPSRFKYLRACKLLKKFSVDCNATNASSLRGTNLRKQLATRCATFELTDRQISQVASFMGHEEKIHREIYRQPLVSVDILDMSKVLEKAQKENNDSNEMSSIVRDQDTNEFEQDASFSNPNTTVDVSGEDTTIPTDPDDPAPKDSLFGCNNQARSTAPERRTRSVDFQRSIQSHRSIISSKILTVKRKLRFSPTQSISEKARRTSPRLILKNPKIPQSKTSLLSPPKKAKKQKSFAIATKEVTVDKKISRRRWTDEEKLEALRRFSGFIEAGTLPSMKEINEMKEKFNFLQEREAPVIKTWIHNQIRKNRAAANAENIGKNVANKDIIRHVEFIFEDLIADGRKPTVRQCEEVKRYDKKLRSLSTDNIQQIVVEKSKSKKKFH